MEGEITGTKWFSWPSKLDDLKKIKESEQLIKRSETSLVVAC